MKKFSALPIFIFCCYCLFTSCNSATPERYFDVAVLNSNMLSGFASDGMLRELDQPSVKMVNGDKDHPVPMKRMEVIDDRIKLLEEDVEEMKELKETEDTKDMLQASRSLYEYAMPVYKTEYVKLAKLYDASAPKEEIQSLAQSIQDKYFTGFSERMDKLITTGKAYAQRHNIKVNWDVRTSPR